ncbi:MAG: TIGR00730 family Rossman fold protein [Campylobacter sp.]
MISEFDKLKKDIKNFNETLKINGRCITFFGSARFDENNKYSQKARELARLLAPKFTIFTGGGGGIMEATNHGASEAGAKSVGINIILPREQDMNKFADFKFTFNYLYVRKCALIEKSDFFVVFPGGFGTLDELFEVITLKQTGKKSCEIYLYDREYFAPLVEFFKISLLKNGAICEDELLNFTLCDDINQIYEKITHQI